MGGVKLGLGFGVGGGILSMLEKIPSALQSSVSRAMDREQIDRKMAAVFKGMLPQATQFAKSFADQIGSSETPMKNILSRAQDTMVPMNFSRRQSFSISKKITQLSADLATSEGMSHQEVADRLISGMAGNTEALRRFGVIASESRIKAELMAMGMSKATGVALQQAKSLAILNIAIRGTRDSQGAAASASGSLQRELESIDGTWQDLSSDLGEILLPSLANLTRFFREFAASVRTSLPDMRLLGRSLGESFGKLLEKLEPVRTQAIEFIGALGEQLKQFVGWVSGLADNWQGWSKLYSGIVDKLKEAADAFGELIAKAVTQGVHAGLTAFRDGTAAAAASSIASGAHQVAMTPMSIMQSMIRGVWNGASAPSMGGESTTTPDGTAGAARPLNIQGHGSHIGGQIANSIRNGVRPKEPAATTSAGDPESNVFDWMNQFIGRKDKETTKLKTERMEGFWSPGMQALGGGLRSAFNMLTGSHNAMIQSPNAPVSIPSNAAGWLNYVENKDQYQGMANLLKYGQVTPPKERFQGEAVPNLFRGLFAIGQKLVDNVSPEKALAQESKLLGGRVHYVGIQDLQSHLQSALNEGESERDKLKLEIMKKNLEAASKTAEAMAGFPAAVSQALANAFSYD